MNCLRCNTENEEGVKFCKNCGMDMTYTPSKENTNSKLFNEMIIVGYRQQTTLNFKH